MRLASFRVNEPERLNTPPPTKAALSLMWLSSLRTVVPQSLFTPPPQPRVLLRLIRLESFSARVPWSFQTPPPQNREELPLMRLVSFRMSRAAAHPTTIPIAADATAVVQGDRARVGVHATAVARPVAVDAAPVVQRDPA